MSGGAALPCKFRHTLFATLALGTALSIRGASAEALYNNGPLYHPALPLHADGYEMTVSITADDFTVNKAIKLESIRFWNLEATGGFQGSILWRIHANGTDNKPGVLLYSGTSTDLTHTATGFVDPPVTEFVNTLTIAPVSLPPGTYWLALHNGPVTLGTNRFFYWEKVESVGVRASQVDFGPPFLDVWWTNAAPNSPNAELAFQLTGSFAPETTAFLRSNGVPRINFTTELGRNYRVEYKNSPSDSQWLPVPGANTVSGTGSVIQVSDPDPNVASQPRRFYRVVLL